MREDGDDGKPSLYWISHKTQLLRCAPHHLRPALEKETDTLINGIQEAKKAMSELKSRGVTRLLDLNVANRRRIEDLESEEEEIEQEMEEEEEDLQPPVQRRRLEAPIGSPQAVAPALNDATQPAPDDEPTQSEPDLEYAPTSPAHSQQGVEPEQQAPPTTSPAPLALPLEALPAVPENQPDTPSLNEPCREPSPPHSRASQNLPASQLDPDTEALYQPAQPGERFELMRRRYDQQETISFGNRRYRGIPQTSQPETTSTSNHRAGPYDKPSTSGIDDVIGHSFEVDAVEPSFLPPGWHMEDGFITMDRSPQDYWEVKAGCLIRHHVVPRRTKFGLQQLNKRELQHLPVSLQKLDSIRITVRKTGQELKQESDVWQNGVGTPTRKAWTGVTIFQINGDTRKEMGMTTHDTQSAKQLGRKQKAMANKKMQKNKGEIRERELSLEHRLLFQQAKQKELSSFFENGVWSFQTTKEATPERTLTSRMLLKWSKNADGSPRAKARLVVRGYADVDALAGSLETSSPASTRLGRNLFLSLSSCLGWTGWSADVSTAFLQGLPQERKLWVRLPSDALALLGADSNTRMFLHKPVYGQLDAPRRWFLEASSRLKQLGWEQHSLDPCFWRLFEPQDGDASTPKLVGLLCLHVDDMLGGGDKNSAVYCRIETEIRKMFNFRTWQQDESFEYCGADMSRSTDGAWTVSHQKFFGKVKPLTIEKGRQTHSPMTPKEQSLLRGLLGSLQWPAVQSSPHLLASTSILSGELSTGLAAPLFEANKLLRFAKDNSDVTLRYPPLGAIQDLRLSCMFDAAHGVRHDGSSQGGFICLLTHKEAFEGVETPYHVLDWKSMKLPRVARSSLAAEAQASSAAADNVEFIVRFWNELFNPQLELKSNLALLESSLQPVLITDAKALYDTYHRDAFNHGSNDKRTALEVKVTRQQVESFGGRLKWVSSERQYGDGLTKLSARQLLADRLRHGSIKYTWDPTYTAAKKKPLESRWSSRNEFTTTGQHDTTTYNSQTQHQVPLQATMDEHTSLEQEPPLLEVPQSANLKEIEVAGSAVGSMPPSHGRALFALLLMSALSPAHAASGDEKPLEPGWFWWLVMVFVAAASCLLGHWLTTKAEHAHREEPDGLAPRGSETPR